MSAEMMAYLRERHEAFSRDLDRDSNPDLPSAARMRSAGAAAVLADLRWKYDPEFRSALRRAREEAEVAS